MTAQVEMKLGDSEIKVMNVIWRLGEPTARQVAALYPKGRCAATGAAFHLPAAGQQAECAGRRNQQFN